MLLILEGIDKCGKTTFAQKFKNCATIKHSTKLEDATAVLLDAVKRVKLGEFVILDRSFLSEMCYGPVYRGEMRITPAKFMQICKALKGIDYCILYFSRPEGQHEEYDANDEFEKEPDKLAMVEARYKDYIARYKNRFNIYEIQYK